MVLGTASDVGKSWVATALCRALARKGLRVAPFKAQNMSNNAAVAGGGEIGRAQWVQAEACGIEPTVDMNPILLKPTGALGSQVVVQGVAQGHQEAVDYYRRFERWWRAVTESYDRLAAAHDVIVLEGAGSPAEINLKDRDLVNLRMAAHAQAHCWLVGDIERGGVFASLNGTLDWLDADERALIKGLVINKFRGDPRLFIDGLAPLEQRAGVPVLGVLRHLRDGVIDAEDSLQVFDTEPDILDIAAPRWPALANFTDLDALADQPGVGVRWVESAEKLGNPDLIVLPGCKDTLQARHWLHEHGFDPVLRAAAARDIPMLGLCGGYQLLGTTLRDEGGVAGTAGDIPGLGLLPVDTTFGAGKAVRAVVGTTRAGWLVPGDLHIEGYEIHQGITRAGRPLLQLPHGPDGSIRGSVAGTYVHGWLDEPRVARALVDALLARRGLPPRPEALPNRKAQRMAMYDRLADELESQLDLARGLPPALRFRAASPR